MSQAKKNKSQSNRTPAVNRRAYHEYQVLESIEAGIVLTGTEIKSIRQGHASITEAFARIENEEAYLHNCHIKVYEQGNIHNHQPDRVRKLLLGKKEIRRLLGKTKEQGLTLIPLKLYFKGPWIKVELGLCKGKKLHDKRDSIKAREGKRDIERALKSNR